ncbi:hypothetical protein HK105_208110 [Polyrhizophydium stewartii]|uniref:Uncharacterized protein n=1 Tax=Polyrhizophydium stewartii TaxID=2732419 RepID=A0ABR4MYR5_9FUNG|nr:hypothetical protein HK105_000951 [Polyrhizophydium stewartii]
MIASLFALLAAAASVVSAAPTPAPVFTFAQVDISRTPGGADAAIAASQRVCAQATTTQLRDAITRAISKGETDIIVPALDRATDPAQRKALTCQLDHSKIQKKVCATFRADKDGNTISAATRAIIAENIKSADTNCAGADARFMVAPDGSTASAPKPAKTAAAPKPAATQASTKPTAQPGLVLSTKDGQFVRPTFAQIDISRTPGGSKEALAAAQKFCANSCSKEQQQTITDVSNKAEIDIFNPAIARATSQAQKDAIQCQKLRNKILKNLCANRSALKRGLTETVNETSKNIANNSKLVDALCPKVDPKFFI